MVKLLYVFGDDFSAELFEDGKYAQKTPKEAWNKANKQKEKQCNASRSQHDNTTFEAHEFECELSEEMLEFIEDKISDYDLLKSSRLYIVEE